MRMGAGPGAKQQARYLVHRQDPDLWAKVLATDDDHRRQLVDQVVQPGPSRSPPSASLFSINPAIARILQFFFLHFVVRRSF